MKIEKLKKSLKNEGLDTFLATQNAQYLADTPSAAVTIVSTKKTILLCRRLDFDRAGKESEIEDTRAYAKSKVPIRGKEAVIFGGVGKSIATILEELESEKIGYDNLEDKTLEEIKANHEAEYREDSDLIWNLRRKKTEEEINRMKKSAEIASKGMEAAKELIEPGKEEIEIAAEIEYEMRKLGSGVVPFDTIVASGSNSSFPHWEATNRELGEEEFVTVDLGAKWKGYCSDMTRTYPISPNSKQEEIIELTKKAQKASLKEVEAGKEVKKIDAAARKVFRDAGMEKYYLHGIGHGVGRSVHEPPNLNIGSEECLEEGMVITVEPGIYTREFGGCRFEDMILVLEDGYEKLTHV